MEHRNLFASAVGAGVPTAGMVPAFAGGGVAATTIMSFIVNIFSIGLRFTQLCIDFKPNGRATEAVFQNFLLIYKLVNCFKLFFSAYRQVHAEGVGLLAFSCLFGLSIHSSTIVIYLNDNHRSHARAWISSMAILVAAGAYLLPMNILADCTWHRTAVEAILICFACIEAFLLVRDMIKETGGDDNLLQNLIMITAETLINYCMLADYVVKTHSNPWDAEKILHLIGSCLSVLIGLGQIGWIMYKAYTHGVFAWGEERAAGGGDVEAPAVEQVAEVDMVEAGCSKTLGPIFLFPVIVNEVGTAEEVPPEDLFGYS